MNYIKKDVFTIVILIIFLSVGCVGLFIYNQKTNCIDSWSNSLYNWVLSK